MATVILRPESPDVTNNWAIAGGESTAFATLNDESNSTYIYHNGNTRDVEVELEALDSVGLNIDTIDSIQAVMTVDNSLRSNSTRLELSYRDSSSNLINSYTEFEDITTSNSAPSTDVNWTSRTTSDGSTLWSDGDIDGMRLRIVITIGPASGYIQISELYLVVTYTELPVLTTYPSAENIVLKNGTIILKNGLTIIQ
tara:strand:+ start:68 stop:661 length:594 start_codon:yes stop_codon:yes gene_type:complete